MILTSVPDFSDFAAHHANAHVVVSSARCSLWWEGEIPSLPGERIGVIGHYHAETTEAGYAALEEACGHLAAQGCTLAIGPMDGNTWRRYRFITESDPAEPPFFLEPTSPGEYPRQWEAAGFTALAGYSSALSKRPDQSDERASRVASRLMGQGMSLRQVDVDCAEEDLRAIYRLSLVSFAPNYLYTPLGGEEFLAQYQRVMPYVRADFTALAHDENGQLVGFLFALPDLKEAQRGEAIRTVIIKTVAIQPGRAWAGLGMLLVDRCQKAALEAGFTRVIHALMHDSNASRNVSGTFAGRPIRRYTLYSRRLAPPQGDAA